MPRIRSITQTMTCAAFEDVRALQVTAILDPSPNWPVTGRVIVGIDAMGMKSADGDPIEFAFSFDPDGAEQFAAFIMRAAADARAAMTPPEPRK